MLFASWNNSYPGHPALTCYSNTITCAYMHVNEHETISHIQAHPCSVARNAHMHILTSIVIAAGLPLNVWL